MVIYIHMKLWRAAGSLSLFGLCHNLCDLTHIILLD